MAKAKFYQTSVTHHTNTNIIKIRMKHGWEGYGIYHALMQVLANTDDRVMSLDELPQIAFSLQVDEALLKEIINNYMAIEGNIFYCQDLEDSLQRYDAIINAASAGGKATTALMTPQQLSERGRKGGKIIKQQQSVNKAQQVDAKLNNKASNKAQQVDAKLNNKASNKASTNILDSIVLDSIVSEEKVSDSIVSEEKIKEEKVSDSIVSEEKIKDEIVQDDMVGTLCLQESTVASLFFIGDSLQKVQDYHTKVNKEFDIPITFNQFEKILVWIVYKYKFNRGIEIIDNNQLNEIINTIDITANKTTIDFNINEMKIKINDVKTITTKLQIQ